MDAIDDGDVRMLSGPAVRCRIGDPEAPVFVDHSGRRARGVSIVGAGIAGLCAMWLAGLLIGVAGFSDLPAGRSAIGSLPALTRMGIAQGPARRAEVREPKRRPTAARGRES